MAPALRIGIDFDNTIVSYNRAFLRTAVQLNLISMDWVSEIYGVYVVENRDWFRGSFAGAKNETRDYLRSLENGENNWQYLQGQVYGKFIDYAELFPGVANFLLHCNNRGIRVYVISHKTEFGHYDPSKTSLRKAALDWMNRQGLFQTAYGISTSDVFFYNTRKEKIQNIVALHCDYFIDDLMEVFLEPDFPVTTLKILFTSSNGNSDIPSFDSWFAINRYIFNDIDAEDVLSYAEKVSNKKVSQVTRVKGRGNSRVFRVEVTPSEVYAAKLYPDPTHDPRLRMETEFEACRLMNQAGIEYVPTPYYKDKNLNFALYDWIGGDPVSVPSCDDLDQAVMFIDALQEMKSQNGARYPRASAACLSGREIEDQIDWRLSRVYNQSSRYPALKKFLDSKLLPTSRKVLDYAKKKWPTDFVIAMEKEDRALSPSDFGFHNAIRGQKRIHFIDFEYFGWDDPAKLTTDFLLHPAMSLSEDSKRYWSGKIAEVFRDSSNYVARLRLAYFLYGLCWCLILLNEFCDEDMSRRFFADPTKVDITQEQEHQLQRSGQLLDSIAHSYKQGFPYE